MDASLKAKFAQLYRETLTAPTPDALLAVATRWRNGHLDESAIVATAISAVAHSTGLVLDQEWKQYDEIAESRQRLDRRKDRALAVLYSIWSVELVDHYQWGDLDRDFLESLALLARRHPRWPSAVAHLNTVMFTRHIRSIHESKFKKIGEHFTQSRLQSAWQPLLKQDVHSLLQQPSQRHGHSEPRTSFVCNQDIENWVNMKFEQIETLKDVKEERLAHYCIRYDKRGMLIPVAASVAQVALRKRKRCSESADQHKASTKLSTVKAHSNLSNKMRGSRKTNATATVMVVSRPGRTSARRSRNGERSSVSSDVDRRASSEAEGPDDSACGSSPNSDRDDCSCSLTDQDVVPDPTESKKLKVVPQSCCAALSYQPPSGCDEQTYAAYRWAQYRHERLHEQSAEGRRICDPYLGWLANTEPARAGIDYIQIDAVSLQERLRKDPRMSMRQPLLVREDFRDKQGYSNRDFIERMMLCMSSGSLEVTVPFDNPPRRRISAQELASTLTKPIIGLNALSMADYIGALPPTVMTTKRFEWLSTVLWALQIADKKAADKSVDVRECLRFDLYACEGAFSGAHLDSLCGTWIRPISGEAKVWMFILGDEMKQADWDEFESLAHNYVPRPGLAHLLFVPVGCTLIMPPGVPIIHAVGTSGTSVNTGGMFWDEECITETLRNINRLVMHQNLTNEPLQLDLYWVVDMMAQLVERSKPETWADGDFQRQLMTFRQMRCECRGSCRRATCKCMQEGRRCTRACWRHDTGNMSCFVEDSDMTR